MTPMEEIKHTPVRWPKLYAVKSGAGEGHGRLNADGFDEQEYTVSDAPNINGWNVDGGYPGYGLSKEWAERIVLAVNSHAALLEALTELVAVLPLFDRDQARDLAKAKDKAKAAIHSATSAGGE